MSDSWKVPRAVDRGDCAPPVLELLPFGQSLIATHCPRPWSGVRRAMGPEHEHRQV